MPKLVIIDDAQMHAMLRNKQIVEAFPFMRNMAEKLAPAKKRGCNCARKNRKNVGDYNGLKAAIHSMAGDKKAQLKSLLGAEQIRLYYTNTKRQKVKVTF
jgi:hypothetical protein